MFDCRVEGSEVIVGESNAYIMDIGAGDLLAYGGNYLSLAKQKIDSLTGVITVNHVYTDTEQGKQLK